LNTGNGTQTQEFDDDDDLFNASVKLKAAKKGKAAAVAIGPLHRVDAFEPLDGDNKNTADVNSAEHEEQERTLRMYWLDYLEADNGVVHLVGKVFDRISGKYVSACVTVGGMQRNLFVLPRTKRNGVYQSCPREQLIFADGRVSQRTDSRPTSRFRKWICIKRSTPSGANTAWKDVSP
jgi:hypothetical protein